MGELTVCLNVIKDSKIENIEHEQYLKVENRKKIIRTILFAALFVLITTMSLSAKNTYYLLLQVLNIIGLALCWAIVQNESGDLSVIAEKLCSVNNNNGCQNVINHANEKFGNSLLDLSDCGIIYFLGSSVFLSIAGISLSSIYISSFYLLILSIMLFVVVFSIFYQWRVIKSWCRLCLLVDVILIGQSLLIYFFIKKEVFELSINLFFISAFSYLVTSVIWLSYKGLSSNAALIEKNNWKLKKFKRSPEVFLSILKEQRKIDLPSFANEIFVGNKNGLVQLFVVCQPFCNPCAKSHKIIQELISKYQKEIGLTICFAIKSNMPRNKNWVAANKILLAWKSGFVDAIDDWYDIMDLESYSNKYPVLNDDESCILDLEEHESWAKCYKINHTPTIFLNQHEFPWQYNLKDLNNMIFLLIENIATLNVVANTDGVALMS